MNETQAQILMVAIVMIIFTIGFGVGSSYNESVSDDEKIGTRVTIDEKNNGEVKIQRWSSGNVDEVQIYVNGDYEKTLLVGSELNLSVSEGDVIQEVWVIEEGQESSKFKHSYAVYEDGKLERNWSAIPKRISQNYMLW